MTADDRSQGLPPLLDSASAHAGGRPAVRALVGLILFVSALFFCRLVVDQKLPSAFCAMFTKGGAPVGQCILKARVGIPCAFCGSTRAWAELSHGHLFAAARFNPIMTALASGGIMVCGAGVVRPRIYRAAACYARRLLRRKSGLRALLIFCALNWIYLIFALP